MWNRVIAATCITGAGLLAAPLVFFGYKYFHPTSENATAKKRIQEETINPSLSSGHPVIHPGNQRPLSESAIIRKVLDPVQPQYRGKPRGSATLYFIGGTAGAGKSTVINNQGINLPEPHAAAHIDCDVVKALLPGWNPLRPADVHIKSREVTDRTVDEAIEQGMDMVVQGTGTRIQHLHNAKQGNYKIAGHFVWVPDDMARRRIDERNQQGGRILPLDFASLIANRIRFGSKSNASISVLNQIKSDFYDSFNLWDNTGTTPKLIASYTKGQHYQIYNNTHFNDFFGGTGGAAVEDYWRKHTD